MAKLPIVIDTDIGTDADDVIALSMALAESDRLELLGVIATGSAVEKRALYAKRILSCHQAGKNVPVYRGCDKLLSPLGTLTPFFDAYIESGDPTAQLHVEEKHGIDALNDIINSREGVILIAVGPMTTVAAALLKYPDLKNRIHKLFIMGGYYTKELIKYNEAKDATLPHSGDYNLCSDPVASLTLLQSGIPTYMVTPNVTLQVMLVQSDLQLLKTLQPHSKLRDEVIKAIEIWLPWQREWLHTEISNVAFLHDPLTVLAVLPHSFLSWKQLHLEYVIQDSKTFRVLCNEEDVSLNGGAKWVVNVAVDVDREKFRSVVMQHLTSLG